MKTVIRIPLRALLVPLATACFAEKPNIVFILVDDQRNDSLSIEGHPYIKTPNIDRLADQGVRFENAFVNTSICMASRSTLRDAERCRSSHRRCHL